MCDCTLRKKACEQNSLRDESFCANFAPGKQTYHTHSHKELFASTFASVEAIIFIRSFECISRERLVEK